MHRVQGGGGRPEGGRGDRGGRDRQTDLVIVIVSSDVEGRHLILSLDINGSSSFKKKFSHFHISILGGEMEGSESFLR